MKRENLERVEESAAPPKPRPILFSGEMVRAILEGRKTQTRRTLGPRWTFGEGVWRTIGGDLGGREQWQFFRDGYSINIISCPYGQPADQMWVRETISQHHHIGFPLEGVKQVDEARRRVWSYTADQIDEGTVTRKRPAIHMPRWASRITLEITKVRVERIQDITCGGTQLPSDVVLEGCPRELAGDAEKEIAYWVDRWDKLNAKRGFGWDANPWVWVIEFKRCFGGR